jgi:hypothetical protein
LGSKGRQRREQRERQAKVCRHSKWEDPELKNVPFTREYIKAKAGKDGKRKLKLDYVSATEINGLAKEILDISPKAKDGLQFFGAEGKKVTSFPAQKCCDGSD